MNALVLLHSSGASPVQWRTFALDVASDFHVFAPTLIGHAGRAGWADGVRPSLDGEVDHLLEQLAPHEGPLHLVGHSYGAAVAIRLAIREPLRVASMAIYEPPLFNILGQFLETYGGHDHPANVANWIKTALRTGRSDRAAEIYVDYWSGVGTFDAMTEDQRLRLAGRMKAVSACFDALWADTTRPSDLQRTNVPTLVMSGSASPSVARDIAEVMAGTMPNARHHRFMNAGHMAPISSPERVAPVIREHLDRSVGVWPGNDRQASAAMQ